MTCSRIVICPARVALSAEASKQIVSPVLFSQTRFHLQFCRALVFFFAETLVVQRNASVTPPTVPRARQHAST